MFKWLKKNEEKESNHYICVYIHVYFFFLEVSLKCPKCISADMVKQVLLQLTVYFDTRKEPYKILHSSLSDIADLYQVDQAVSG